MTTCTLSTWYCSDGRSRSRWRKNARDGAIEGWRGTQGKPVGWTLPEMVKDVLHSRLVGEPQHGDWRGDGMRMTEGLCRARMRAFLARLSVVLRARHRGRRRRRRRRRGVRHLVIRWPLCLSVRQWRAAGFLRPGIRKGGGSSGRCSDSCMTSIEGPKNWRLVKRPCKVPQGAVEDTHTSAGC